MAPPTPAAAGDDDDSGPLLRLAERLQSAFDGDDVEEVETAALQALERAETRIASLTQILLPYRQPLWAAVGLVSVFYGANFKYTILFGRTFASTGWPFLQPAVLELRNSYARARQLHTPQEGLVNALGSIASAVDPAKLTNVFKAAYIGLSSSFAAVLSESAGRVGVGIGLGDRIAKTVNALFQPLISRCLRSLNSTNDAWVDSIISWVSTALGVYVAHRVDDLIYVYSACLAGATVFVERVSLMGKPRLSRVRWVSRVIFAPQTLHLAIGGLAAAGFARQQIRGSAIPLLLRAPLAPLYVVEGLLSSVAFSIRARTATS